MKPVITLIEELSSQLETYVTKCRSSDGPNDYDNVILRDRLFGLMEAITHPHDWAVEMVEVMTNVEQHLSKGTLPMDIILSVIEPDQLALMSEIIAAVDRDPSWGR